MAATATKTMPRLKEKYRYEIAPALQEEFRYDNVMQIPGLVKIVVNMGVGEAARDSKVIDGAVRDLTPDHRPEARGDQGPQVGRPVQAAEGHADRRARHPRGDRMWEFADRLLTLALPRIRDFRGLSPKQFDGKGNYTFGLNEQVMFHEINQDRIDRVRGMDITFVTTATNDDEGRALLALWASRSSATTRPSRSSARSAGVPGKNEEVS